MSNLLSKASILLTPTATSDGKLHSVKPIQTFGSDLVVNGDFADNSTWTTQSSVTFTNGTVIMDSASQNAFINQNILTVGRKYRVSITVEALSVVHKLDLINASGITYESFGVGVNVFEITANQTAFRIRTKDGATSTISRASVQEITDGDFDFTRATTSTRVGPNGLIQNVASGLPRIDFLGGTGQILLEPASTNTATYSSDFTQGDIFSGSADPSLNNAVLTANQGTAPDGTNTASLLKDNNDGSTGASNLNYFGAVVVSDNFNTFSVFAKKSLSSGILMELGNYDDGFPTAAFNLENGTLGFVNSNITAKIEDYGSGWYRCQVTFQTTTDVQGLVRIGLTAPDGGSNITRDGTNGVLLFGLQAEADASRNFATSYIPTSGSTVTRNADQANNSGDSSLINSTEGVLYAEILKKQDVNDNYILISLNNDASNSADNSVSLGFNNNNHFFLRVKSNGSDVFANQTIVANKNQFYKISLKYKSGNIACFIDGVEVATSTSTFSFSQILDNLSFDFNGNGTLKFFGKVKTVAVFKEALTDAQLISLTS